MTVLQVIIVLEWLLIATGAAVFLLLYGWPWRYGDKVMSWHLFAMAAVTLVEVLGLFVAGISLVPSAIAYGLSTAIIWWRMWLLLRSRRRR